MELGVLIVDDAPVIQMTMRKMLERAGIDEGSIHVATDADEALSRFAAHRPQVVFLDIQLGDVGGEKVAADMLGAAPDTKIVIVSSLDRDDQRVSDLIAAGAYDVLRKPIHQEAIVSTVNRVQQDLSGAGRIR